MYHGCNTHEGCYMCSWYHGCYMCKGVTGVTWTAGVTGVTCTAGATCVKGVTGVTGTAGVTGVTCTAGVTCVKGVTGVTRTAVLRCHEILLSTLRSSSLHSTAHFVPLVIVELTLYKITLFNTAFWTSKVARDSNVDVNRVCMGTDFSDGVWDNTVGLVCNLLFLLYLSAVSVLEYGNLTLSSFRGNVFR